ncbi:MAG: glycosyltransferase family 2 protein [Bacteroidales bacterium]
MVSIITVNYRQSAVTNALLRSLKQVKGENFETIVVDNSGTDDYLNLDIDWVNTYLVISPVNRGFAAANNLGLKHAKGEYILFLNNDTVVSFDFLRKLTDTFRIAPNIGAVSPKILYFDQPTLLQYTGYGPMHPITLRMKGRGFRVRDEGQFETCERTHFAHGCAMMVKRSVIDQVGMMPEEYFLYYEEHAWSLAIQRAGYAIYYQPKALVYHRESVSVQKDSPMKTYYLTRNRILLMRNNLFR